MHQKYQWSGADVLVLLNFQAKAAPLSAVFLPGTRIAGLFPLKLGGKKKFPSQYDVTNNVIRTHFLVRPIFGCNIFSGRNKLCNA